MSTSDIYSLLERDHEQVSTLFQQLTEDASPASRKQLCAQIEQALRLHTEAEEKTFYAALNQHEDLRDMIADARDDHQQVTELLNSLSSMDMEDEEWEDLVMEIQENVESHVDEEENELFPRAQEVLSEQEAEQLGQRFQQQKQQLKK